MLLWVISHLLACQYYLTPLHDSRTIFGNLVRTIHWFRYESGANFSFIGSTNHAALRYAEVSDCPEVTSEAQLTFKDNRSLYEVRERPSKTYSWATFMLYVLIYTNVNGKVRKLT